MPAALGRFDSPAEQGQPQAGIELPVEKETLLAIRFGFGNDRLRQRGLVWPEAKSQRRKCLAQALILTCNHKLTCIRVTRCQFIVKEPQNGLVMVWDIRSQDVNQCSHARLRHNKNTPQQAAK